MSIVTRKTEIIVEVFWIKPFFKKGYSEYRVVRKTTDQYGSQAYTPASVTYDSTVIYKSLDITEAVSFKDKLLEAGVK